MPNKTFFWFFLPTGLAMVLFIGLPIISTGVQSFYAQHDQVVKEVKKCDPFGCTVSIVVDNEETTKIREAKPLGKFNGFGTPAITFQEVHAPDKIGPRPLFWFEFYCSLF